MKQTKILERQIEDLRIAASVEKGVVGWLYEDGSVVSSNEKFVSAESWMSTARALGYNKFILVRWLLPGEDVQAPKRVKSFTMEFGR